MYKMKKIWLIALALLIVMPCSSAFSFELFDGRLHDGKGRLQQTLMIRTHRDDRDISVTSFRSMARIEGLFDLAKTENNTFKLYGFFEYWEDFGAHIDGGLKRSIRNESGGSHELQNYYRSNEEQEIIKELYADMDFGYLWNMRLGKQIVNWGETSESRVADQINPLDVTNLVGYPDWEDYKVGLWMARIFLTPESMWSDMSFELIVIPYMFEEVRVSPAGSGFFLGKPITPTNGVLTHRWRQDKPDDGWENTEVGFKVRGMTGVTDWTLSVFHTRQDGPPLLNELKGFTNYLNGDGDVFRYTTYTSYATTFSRPVKCLGAILSGEAVLNAGKEYQYGTYDIKEKNVFISALGLDKNIQIPWLSKINKGVSLISNITWYHYKMLDYDHNSTTGEYVKWEGGSRSAWDKISIKLQTSFFDHTLLTGISSTYDLTDGSTDYVARMMYFPGDHWFYEVSYQQINERLPNNVGNQVIFNVRYEF